MVSALLACRGTQHSLPFASLMLVLLLLVGCGSGDSGPDITGSPGVEVTPNLLPISLSGLPVQQGNFDPAPTIAADGTIWMSYSHVSVEPSGLIHIETRLATTPDAGLSWADAGVLVNEATSLPLAAPFEVNAYAQEVSRLLYNPYAVAAGADPWVMVWHRYLSVLSGEETVRLFQHGWLGMKSGATASTLGGERKLFTGSMYDTTNNSDALGAPEYPLNTMYPAGLGACVTFTEPGLLAKSEGIYVALFCADGVPPGKIVLLRCDHHMNGCVYVGDLLDGGESSLIDASYDNFSAPELVSSGGQDYLIVTPSSSPNSIYSGCVAYKITDITSALVKREAGEPVAHLIIGKHGDFNGACGYVEGLTGSGMMIGEVFVDETPAFRLFTTGANLP